MIRTDKLSYSIADFHLREFSIEVAQGQYFVLLGPAGSGKTVFLECLSGLNQIQSGRVYIGDRDVTDLEPRSRNIGYVPQDYALFPHLSVEGNIAFGLVLTGLDRRTIRRKITQTVEMLGLDHLLRRGIQGLSGGERQRVALARALVMQPKVLLLDEPVCALDEATRQQVCVELQHIQRQFGITTIHVSHNLEEVFLVADKAGILCDGDIQQTGSIDELLRRPQNELVARFMRCDNIFNGEMLDLDPRSESTTVRCGQARLVVSGHHQGRIKFMIRPENVLLLACDQQHSGPLVNKLPVKLIRSRDCGNYVRMELKGNLDLVAHLSHAAFAELSPQTHCDLVAVLRIENIHIFPI